MKILFVTHYGELYGANLSMCNVAYEINNREGYQADVLSLTDSCPDLEEWCNNHHINIYKSRFYNTTYPIKSKIIPYIKSRIKFMLNEYKLKNLDDIINDGKYDVIHSNTMATLVGAMIAKRHSINHVWHIREFMDEDYGVQQLKCGESRRLFDYTSCFIAISHSIEDKYRKTIPEKKIKLIYNGVPNNVINTDNERTVLKKKDYIFAFLGVLRKEKGVLDVVKAFRKALEITQFKNVKLWIIGGNPEDKDEYTREVVAESKKADGQIKLLGYTKNVGEYLKYADIGVVSSKKEAFGRVTVEFLQNGLFVIGANSGGTKEIINSNHLGVLYTPGDIDELTRCIISCLNNQDNIKKYSEYRKKRADYFSIGRCTDEILDVYKKLRENQ